MTSELRNNLFWRLMKTEWPSADGHEDFVTEALASVLYADQALARHFMQSLLPIELDQSENVEVLTQSAYASGIVGSSSIDLELRSNSALLFVENKIGAPLNSYLVESDENSDQVIDQIEKYDLVLRHLDDSHPSKRFLIVIGQEPLKQADPGLSHFYRDFLWWDVYKIIDEFYASAKQTVHLSENHQYLASEFLRFMQLTHLDPPKKLSLLEFSVSDAVRLLAEAIRKATGHTKVKKAKNETGFKIFTPGRNFEIWFDNQPTVRAYEENVGGLKAPKLENSFWSADVSGQREYLEKIVKRLPILERDDSAPITVDEALNQFRCRSQVENIIEAILERWPQSPNTGKKTSKVKEISFQTGRIKVRLSPYKLTQHISFNTGKGNEELIILARRLINESFGHTEPPGKLKEGQVNLPIELILKPEDVKKLIDVIENLAETPIEG